MPAAKGLNASKFAPQNTLPGSIFNGQVAPFQPSAQHSPRSQDNTANGTGAAPTPPVLPPHTISASTSSSSMASSTASSTASSSSSQPPPKRKPDSETSIEVPDRKTQVAKIRHTSKSLRLTPVRLVSAASITTDFSIDAILLQHTGENQSFSLDVLAGGIAQGCSVQALRLYLEAFMRTEIEEDIKKLVKGKHPVLSYAAERNIVECVRLLLEIGCDANARDADDVPTLGYAIMRSKSTLLSPAEVVKMLLAFGATPDSIPGDMWMNYLESPTPTPRSDDVESDEAASWCTSYHRKLLASALNLSVRYYLHKATKIPAIKERQMQLAQAHNYTALLKMPYLIIGQDYATKQVGNVVAAHIAMQQKKPLVLVFAGLSGHGKTELAKQMGNLLQIPMTVIDCAQMHSHIALFGARLGYHGNATGSQLNNFLSDNSGSRACVFMDEFDKTEANVHASLLLTLDSGNYHDRRNNKPVDASKTIWVMATNLGDQEITAFYRNHLESANSAEKAKMQYEGLTEQLKMRFRNTFGAPMAGRMKNVAPFFPFDNCEQAVIVHKFLMELVEQVRHPIDTSTLIKHYPGHVHLALKNDGKLCAHLAEKGYIEDLGARSLDSAIDDVRLQFFTAFTDTDELVHEGMNDGALMKFTVQMQPLAGAVGDEMAAMSKVGVKVDGYSDYVRGQGEMPDGGDQGEDEWDLEGLNDEFAKM